MDDKTIVEIVVLPGINRTYYIREKGLKPSGVYVRKGSSSQPVTEEIKTLVNAMRPEQTGD